MTNRTHKLVDVNGTRIHVVEEGEGPLVIMVHGFPELWYSYRHQLTALADAGYRAVAIDKRGYGQSSKYWNPDEYRIHKVVGDLTGLVTALGETSAVLVGHDWGAPVVWTAAWLHPEVFSGVVGLSVPFSGRGIIALPGNPFGEREPDDIHRYLSGPDQDFYQVYFGTLGPIIDEIESDVRGWLRDLYWGWAATPPRRPDLPWKARTGSSWSAIAACAFPTAPACAIVSRAPTSCPIG